MTVLINILIHNEENVPFISEIMRKNTCICKDDYHYKISVSMCTLIRSSNIRCRVLSTILWRANIRTFGVEIVLVVSMKIYQLLQSYVLIKNILSLCECGDPLILVVFNGNKRIQVFQNTWTKQWLAFVWRNSPV